MRAITVSILALATSPSFADEPIGWKASIGWWPSADAPSPWLMGLTTEIESRDYPELFPVCADWFRPLDSNKQFGNVKLRLAKGLGIPAKGFTPTSMPSSVIVGVTNFDEIRRFHPPLTAITPPRSSTLILQSEYSRTGGHHFTYYFDADTKLLFDFHESFWICGFCPHVLVKTDHWRLEGKMLAGCVGSARASRDAMILPTFDRADETIEIRLANWAPEIEYVKDIAIGVVPLQAGEGVELDRDQRPWIVKNQRQATTNVSTQNRGDDDRWEIDLGRDDGKRVAILELRNRGDFETAMRHAVMANKPWPRADLAAKFDTGETMSLPPIGTKFPRRLAIPLPAGAKTLTLQGPCGRWLVRRTWLAHGEIAKNIAWLASDEAAPACLQPLDDVILRFAVPLPSRGPAAVVLRMSGHYEFLSTVPEELERKLRAIEAP